MILQMHCRKVVYFTFNSNLLILGGDPNHSTSKSETDG